MDFGRIAVVASHTSKTQHTRRSRDRLRVPAHERKTMKPTLHLNVLNGVRSLTSIGIIWIHVHFIFGTLFFHSAVPCYAAMHNFPLMRAFEKPSFHLNTFWLISGFLCEFQLEAMIQRRSKSAERHCLSQPSLWEFTKFFLNRILRIMPVYTLVVFLIFHGQSERKDELADVKYKCTTMVDVARALTFTIDYGKGSMLCAQHGWTLQNDVHGYLVFTVLAFASTRFQTLNWLRRHKTAVYWSLYLISILVVMLRRPFDWQHLTGDALNSYRTRASGGLDYLTRDEIKVADGLGANLDTLWDPKPFDAETFAYTRHRMFEAYWSGIFGHGGSIFLGGALCSSLHDNGGKPSSLTMKVTMALVLLYITDAEFALSSLPTYFLLEALLCEVPNSPLAFLRSFLSLDIWTWLSPYTFGIYMVHFVALFKRSEMTVVARANAIRDGEEACKNYSMVVIIRETLISFCVSLGLSALLYYTLELPFRVFRKRYLSQSKAGDISAKKNV